MGSFGRTQSSQLFDVGGKTVTLPRHSLDKFPADVFPPNRRRKTQVL